MIRLAVVLGTVLAIVHTSQGLSCVLCTPEICSGNDTSKCKFGIVKDVCGCCDVCGKGPGDKCGGLWGIEGTCGPGYKCDKSARERESYFSAHEKFSEGVCVVDQTASIRQPTSVFSRSTGGRATSGLVGVRFVGNAKRIATKHQHSAYGSNIPAEFAAYLRRLQNRKKN